MDGFGGKNKISENWWGVEITVLGLDVIKILHSKTPMRLHVLPYSANVPIHADLCLTSLLYIGSIKIRATYLVIH